MINSRNLPFALLLLAAVALSMIWPRLPMSGDPNPLASIPSEGFDLKSRDVELSELEKKWLGGASGLKRIFSHGSRLWLLAVTDGTKNRQSVHDPTYCFLGEGWKIIARSEVPLAGGSATLVTMSRNAESSQALYWFFDGDAPFASVPEFWIKSTVRRLTRGLSGPEPLLFILRPLGPPSDQWIASASEAAPLFLPSSVKK